MTELMTSEAKPLFPCLSPNQLATRELYKLVWKWFPSKLREPVGLKLLLQIIVKLHLWHLGFTFISNCLMPDYTSHISYKRYKLGMVQNRTLKMEEWTQKFCVTWWSGLAEKYLITTGNIWELASRPCLKTSGYTLSFPLHHHSVVKAPDWSSCTHSVPFSPLSICTIY